MLGSCSTSSFTPCQAPQQRKKGISLEKQFGVLKPSSFKRKQIVSRLGRDSNGFISETGGAGRRDDNLKKERTKMVPIEEAFVRGVPNGNDIKINVIVPNDTIANGYSNGAARRGQTTTAMVPASLLARDRPAIDTNEAISRGSLIQFNNLDDGLNILPSDEGFSWSKENYNRVQRTIDIWTFVSLLRARIFLIDSKWTYPTGYNEEKQKARRRKTAEWVRESILQLGPTFIKLGQLSSTRSDLFPVEFVEELSKLQDRVPAFSPEKAQSFIERELGDSVDALFKEFEKRPIAAASLGQVHRAVLPNGEKVVIKVQRPGLKELFDIDLSNLKIIAEYFQNSESLGGPTRDWLGIYEECATTLYQEIDYINEGRNADRFRSDFRNNKWVRVPAVFWDYTSRKVITLQYLPGIKINDIVSLDGGSFDRALIAKRAIEAYLIQILRTGFFHADPHPGNLAVDKDGSLIYYDFGMMGEIKSFTREKLLELFYAVYEKDANKVLNGLIELGALQPTGDLGSVRRSVQFFLDNLMNQKPDENTTLSAIGEDLFAIAVDQPFRFPSTFVFVLRAFTTLEGIGNILDPNFSFTNVAAPYAQELLDTRESKRNRQYVVQEIQRQVSEVRDAAVSMPQRIQRMENFIKQLETGDFKLRVRVLENERAARKASILQFSTLNAIGAAALLNAGVTLFTQELPDFAAASFLGAGVFSIFVILGLRRVSRLDKFEGRIK